MKQPHSLIRLTWFLVGVTALAMTLGLVLNQAQSTFVKNIETRLTNEAKLVGYYWLERITPRQPIPDTLPLLTNQTIGCLLDKPARRVVCNDRQNNPQRLNLLLAHLIEKNGMNSMSRQGDYYIVSRGLAFDTPVARGVYIMTLLPALPINTFWQGLFVRIGTIGLLFTLLACTLVVRFRSKPPARSTTPYATE